MTDFNDELLGKAYALINDQLALEDFKSWLVLKLAARGQGSPPTTPARKDGEFSDYYQAPYEPMDGDMEAHHRKLMGEGEP